LLGLISVYTAIKLTQLKLILLLKVFLANFFLHWTYTSTEYRPSGMGGGNMLPFYVYKQSL